MSCAPASPVTVNFWFARRYADQNERDHAQLDRAGAAGTVESLPSPAGA